MAAAGVLLTLLALSGCASGGDADIGPISLPSLAPVGVDAATPELRRMRVRAGIETCVPGPANGGAGEPPAVTLPALTLPCLGGGPSIDLSALRGPLVLNIWGSWCAPCRDELPILAEFYEKHGDQVALLGIDFQDTRPEDALELAEASGVKYPQLFDHDGAIGRTSLMPAPAVPALAFVDASGAVTAWVPGEVRSERQLIDLVRQHLGVDL